MSKAKVRNALIAAAISSVILSNMPKAEADGVDTAAQFIKDNWGQIVSSFWSPYWKQVWYHNISPQEKQGVQRDYQDRAGGVLQNRCIDRWNSNFLRGMDGSGNYTVARWMFASRSAANGGTDCFIRLPNRIADNFDRAMRKR